MGSDLKNMALPNLSKVRYLVFMRLEDDILLVHPKKSGMATIIGISDKYWCGWCTNCMWLVETSMCYTVSVTFEDTNTVVLCLHSIKRCIVNFVYAVCNRKK